MNKNPFQYQEEDPVIACVGSNGGTYNEQILNGFKRTVEILIMALNKNTNETEDWMVYPIAYNARHSIELYFKIIIEKLNKISSIKNPQKTQHCNTHTHDIEILLKHIINLSSIDRRIPPYCKDIESLVKVYYFDRNGDAFKYESDTRNHHHLEKNNISHISINTLGKQFQEIMTKCDILAEFLDICIDEYSLDTFTRNLSREDIFHISEQLPPYCEWRESSFQNAKNLIKNEYNINNSEFSKALNIIQKHREFCVNIGLEVKFGEIPSSELESYVKWICEELDQEKDSNKTADTASTISAGKKLRIDSWRSAHIRRHKHLLQLSTETCNLLISFSHLSEQRYKSEHLEDIYNYYTSKTNTNQLTDLYWERKLGKVNMCKNIICGMQKCGQISYINKLKQLFSQNSVSVEIKKVGSGIFFVEFSEIHDPRND